MDGDIFYITCYFLYCEIINLCLENQTEIPNCRDFLNLILKYKKNRAAKAALLSNQLTYESELIFT